MGVPAASAEIQALPAVGGRSVTKLPTQDALAGSSLGMHAVERAHFFTQPVDVPLVDRNNTFGGTLQGATEVGEGKAGRLAPEAAEMGDTD